MFRQNWGRGFRIVSTSHVILSPWPCSHPMAPPRSALISTPPGGAVSPQMAAPASDAVERKGRDTCVFRLLWKEDLQLCPGSQSSSLVLGSHPWALLTCAVQNKALKPIALVLLSEFPLLAMVREKEMATHSSIVAWRSPGTEEPGGLLLSMGSHRVGHD